MSDSLLIERDGRVAVLTMNRPSSKNSLDQPLVQALAAAITEQSLDTEVRCIVLTGSGGAFSSGADLKASMGDPSAMADIGQRLDSFHRITRAIVQAPKPVIASIDGPAVGYGCDLALCCDLRVMSTRAYLQEKFVRIGLMPDGGGTRWLPRLVGTARAMEIILTGDEVDAQTALELGICNRVAPHDELHVETMKLAHRVALAPPLAVAGIKRAVHQATTVDETLALEKEHQVRCLRSADFLEGVAAWMQKREPHFRGE